MHLVLSSCVQLDAATSKLRVPERNVTVSLSPAAATALLHLGHDVSNGARPLRRLIERLVVTKLSKLTVGGQLPGHSEVKVDVEGHRLAFRVTSQGGSEAVYFESMGREEEEEGECEEGEGEEE